MSIRERIRNKLFGPPVEDLIVDLSIYNKEIARTRDKYRDRARTLYEQAKECLIKGDDHRARMYAQQHLSADRTAFALDMFVINMDKLIFDLKSAVDVNQMGVALGKISKCLNKLQIAKVGGVSQVLRKVTAQMTKIGVKTENIMDQLKDYEPFSVEPVTSRDLDKLMDKMVTEVIAEGPAMGLPETKLAELQKKREALKGYGSEETK